MAPALDHSLTMIAFVFAAIGFGTKAGLFPMEVTARIIENTNRLKNT